MTSGNVPKLSFPFDTTLAGLLGTLAAFAGIAYGSGLSLPFIGDDYVFLDKTRTASFLELWSLQNTDFGWYRPWSREVHFWFLQRIAGLHETAFRTAGVVLWITGLGLFALAARRLSTMRIAGIATLGVACLALWATPLLWISGSQDLWLLVFATASLNLFIAGKTWWAAAPLALGLLSKETAAALPALLCAYAVFVERRKLGTALRRTAHLWALVAIWLIVHPTILQRLTDPDWQQTPEVTSRPSQLGIAGKTLLAALNLDMFPRPVEVSVPDLVRLMAAVVVLVAGAMFVMRARTTTSEKTLQSSDRRQLFKLGMSWMAVGWLPLLLPSISWHAYYGCFGALGAWFTLALWLDRAPRTLVPTLTCLVLLQWAHARTVSWDWGNEWYQRRAGRMLDAIREHLLHQHPTLPPHSRVYFGHLPNNIGLVAGQSPALRVWYGDATLEAGFYSWYRPRNTNSSPGRDYFFRFDSLAGMIEVKAGAENVKAARALNPQWEFDHEALAMLFLRSGDTSRAALEFEKLSELPHRADAAVFASVCYSVVGDSMTADALLRAAQARTDLSWVEMQSWVKQLNATMPGSP